MNHDPTQVNVDAGYDASEQDILLDVFTDMLRSVTKDGGRKRAAGTKPPWWRDQNHFPAILSHLNKRAHGELHDPDSGAHPYVHLAWRALAIAYQETEGMRDPREIIRYNISEQGRELADALQREADFERDYIKQAERIGRNYEAIRDEGWE